MAIDNIINLSSRKILQSHANVTVVLQLLATSEEKAQKSIA